MAIGDVILTPAISGDWAFALKLSLLKHFKNSTADFETVRDIKENLCYLSYDYKREYQLGLETTILLKNYTVVFEFY
ncbi:Actin-related protein 2 [Camellia lanceoleosa]|uniref:Actin-related protein 2 n=1 Tax=Camellia lanceoleosa TaxID=1840588 RepID=A0ACC0GSV2_9ERIC|nr:Actin-related protein 2 [Camellia lanceoleosa]